MQFQEVALSIGLTSSVSGRGLSNIDYDNDGDQDLVIFPYAGPLQLYRNDLSAPNTHWLRVFLDRGCSTTVPSNGVGAIVRATVGPRTWMRVIEAGTNYLSNSELSAHFGLAAAASVDTLTVEWPDGQVTTLSNVIADRTITVRAPPSVACSAPFGPGCSGSQGVPELHAAAGSAPAIGTTYTVTINRLDAAGAPAIMAVALNGQTPALDLGFLGMPGCALHVGGLATQFNTLVNSGGVAGWSLQLPLTPAIQGMDVYLQAVAFDTGLPNAFGAVVSNGLRASIY